MALQEYKMKILILNTLDTGGGASRSAYRLHQALLNNGIDSQMLVQNKSSDDWTVVTTYRTKIQKFIHRLRPFLDSIPTRLYKNKAPMLFSPSWLGFNNIADKINAVNPDIAHLHWITFGMIKVEDIAKIKAPIVWSLHDMWAFTGGCHYADNCERYVKNCSDCPVLHSNKTKDLSRKVWIRKQKTFKKINNLTIVGLSQWLNNCSQNSALLKDRTHINLPNPIDTNIFKPLDKIKARVLWNLPTDKKLILFGADRAISNTNKGFKKLSTALNKLQISGVELIVFGSSAPKRPQKFGFKTHYIGHLHDDISLITLYSVADVVVVPSLQENLSNVIMESLACSTPVVGFDIGGNADMISHKNNGYLAKPFDTTDLKNGIEWVLNNNNYAMLCDNARKKVLETFDSTTVAKQYIKLYKSILSH